MKILVTGAAGFIGMHVAQRLLTDGHEVVGLDNLNDYYDVSLKLERLERLLKWPSFSLAKISLADDAAVAELFERSACSRVVHLGAQAGVRYSLTHPHTYVDSNIRGTVNILEGCRRHAIEHLVFASSSSVYGMNRKMPYSPHDGVDHPISLYASTKRAGELLCHSHSALFGVPVTALRFFTVYGPWGRPDMSPMLFAGKIMAGESIDLFNEGRHKRDFTFIDDIVESVVRVLAIAPKPNASWNTLQGDPASSSAPFRVLNIGNSAPVELMYFIELLERALGKTAIKRLLPMQPGDVEDTWAEVAELEALIDYRPQVSIEEGVGRFVDWFKVFGSKYA